eukprot:gene8673-10185_t
MYGKEYKPPDPQEETASAESQQENQQQQIEESNSNNVNQQPRFISEFLADFSNKLWFTYRQGFPYIGDSFFENDCGWGFFVSEDGSLYVDQLLNIALLPDGSWTPLLILIPTKLGIDTLNELYYKPLLELYKFPQSLGIIHTLYNKPLTTLKEKYHYHHFYVVFQEKQTSQR